MQIPWTSLSADTLRAVIEEFVTREGTDYGEGNVPLEHKVDTVQQQLQAGHVGLFYDVETESCTLLPIAGKS